MTHSQHTTAISLDETQSATLAFPAGSNGTGRAGSLRRNSWLSNLHTKFGGSSPSAPLAPVGEQVTERVADERQNILQNGKELSAESKASSGYIISKLRRLSSSGQGASTRASAKCQSSGQEQCPRMTLNKNQTRQKCYIGDLDNISSAMKRVAFSLDVQFAPPSPLHDDPAEDEADGAPPMIVEDGRASQDRRLEMAIVMDRNEILMRPAKVHHLQDAIGIVTKNETQNTASLNGNGNSGDSLPSTADAEKERRRRERRERKERKEVKKHKQQDLIKPAIEGNSTGTPSNGSTLSIDNEHKKTSTSRKEKSTECYKKYKRYCHLRELSVLPSISYQLQKQSGPIISLDLSYQHLSLTDIIPLCDFLALTTLKSLILDDCNLTDEGLRIILASLLPSKKPHHWYTQDNEKTSASADPSLREPSLEILSLRNNGNLGRDGWRYLCYFVRLATSLKSLDISGNRLPLTPIIPNHSASQRVDVGDLFAKVIHTRGTESELDELNIGHCDFNSKQLSEILVGSSGICIKKLGIAGIADAELMPGLWRSIRRWQESGGIALGLSDSNIESSMPTFTQLVHDNSPLVVLELKNCSLTSNAVSLLLSSLALLPNFRMLNLSDNPMLFQSPNSVSVFRQNLPKLRFLKRLYLENVSLTLNQVIALTEIFAEAPRLAYINLLRNHLNDAHKSGADDEGEAAMFTALVACARVSKSIVAIDIDFPESSSTIFVKSLARKLVGFCLRNMERGAEVSWDDELIFRSGNEEVNNVRRAVSPARTPITAAGDADEEDYDHGEEDFVADGSGVVKALDVCLKTLPAHDKANLDQNSEIYACNTGVADLCGQNQMTSPEKAREVSKSLLSRARRIREKVIAALSLEQVDENHQKRLVFLNETLDRTIDRFEQEYPECRLSALVDKQFNVAAPDADHLYENNDSDPDDLAAVADRDEIDDDETCYQTLRRSRHSSDVSLAARALDSEEGQMHKIGHYISRQFYTENPERARLKSEIIDSHIEELRYDTDGLETC